MFGPFLPVFAQGMGISVAATGSLVSIRSGTGIMAPVFGALADRMGYRPVILWSLLVSSLGVILVGAIPSVWAASMGMLLLGVGTVGSVPALMAYLSDRLPARRRARGLGGFECSLGLAGVFGVPLAGLLIERLGWRAPFLALGIGLMVACAVFSKWDLARGTEHVTHITGTLEPTRLVKRLWSALSLGPDNRSTWSTAMFMGLVGFSGANVSIMYGTWLQSEYSLGVVQLGVVAMVFGVAELCGSLLVVLAGDQLGRRPTLILGTACMLATCAALPFLNRGLLVSVAGIAVYRLWVVVNMVACAPLLSELVALQRARAFGLGLLFALSGVSVAGLTGPAAYLSCGVLGLSVISAAAAVVSLMLLLFGVRPPSHPHVAQRFTLTTSSETPV
jgi:predicted MFS family arabinose efflux permease